MNFFRVRTFYCIIDDFRLLKISAGVAGYFLGCRFVTFI
jgi:hypothetical protein